MRYYKKLYIGDNIEESVVSRLKKGQSTFNVYAVCVIEASASMFEILSLTELCKEYNLSKDYAVVALVNGKTSAENAVVVMLENWLDRHKDLQGIKNYYNNNSL
jgi:hypothetical protein